MPKKLKKEIAIYIGVFDSDEQSFKWSKYKEYNEINKGITDFTELCKKCLNHTYNFLTKTYDSPRIDIELRVGAKMIKWFGLNEKSQEQIDKIMGNVDKQVEDSLPQNKLFNTGEIVITRGASSLARRLNDVITINESLDRFKNGDWGDVNANDAKLNDEAVKNNGQILGSYQFVNGDSFWIITDYGHKVTTVLLPEEY